MSFLNIVVNTEFFWLGANVYFRFWCFISEIEKSKLVILTGDLIYAQQERDICSPVVSDQHSDIVNNSCIFSYGFPSKVLFCEFLRNYFHIWVCVFLFHLDIFILSKLFIHPQGIEVILDLRMKSDNHLRWTSSLRVLWTTFKSNTLVLLAILMKRDNHLRWTFLRVLWIPLESNTLVLLAIVLMGI